MAKSRSPLWATVVLIGGALILSGCATELPVPPLPEPTQPEMVEPEIQPLSWYTDQVWAEHKRAKQAEDMIAGCMAFNGFEYVAEVGSSGNDETAIDREQNALEHARDDGFGLVSAYLASQEEVELTLGGPNAEYFEELAPDTQETYLEALDGTQENGFEGCRSEAQLFTMNTDPSRVYQDEAFRELVAALDTLPEEIAEDPRTNALQLSWNECMLEQGFTELTHRSELEESLQAELEALSDPTTEQLEAFREREIAAATAEMTCAIETQWAATTEAIEQEHHEQFVAERTEELEALITEYGI